MADIENQQLTDDILVQAVDLTKSYRHQEVLHHINLTVKRGERIGIVGPNGTGKTTLCEILAQLRKPTSGTVSKPFGVRIGMQLQESRYPKGITGFDLMNLYLKAYKIPIKPKEIYQILLALQIEKIINKDITKLSGGQQQKINILLALIVNPDLIILDELATGLDLEIKETIYNLINDFLTEPQKGLLLISHNMEEIEQFCKTLIFMVNGKIINTVDVATVVTEYGSVEKYVKTKFKEYQIGAYNQNYTSHQEGLHNEKWAKSWAKYIDKEKDK
ncbi:ATP-binding cassette domain-containing protein [Spiroplasma eriocheiris]|uniref:ABC transporter ATP-binding protein n=1 Tax=Spiroplasma eriocheiris TaxID=315358 RepID=A0A0H3XMJ1_9MOLU|nr:ABC transporter ATP-binding protein [Spiroplasma eriocheiris]AHF57716.1 ABC-type multidrug transport system ATP-binding protein [Spiroplasma eriocheiris CCTCC M 207170]AKM54167.1 ABC transporter ATP-binding protein [Spiroplasma eriocheiris]